MKTTVNYHNQDGGIRTVNVNRTATSRPVDVLAFRRGQDTAVIVTDGQQTRVFERAANTAVASLKRGIAMLESKGYAIDTEEWQ